MSKAKDEYNKFCFGGMITNHYQSEYIKELESEKAELIEFVKDIVEYDAETVLYNREKLLQKNGVS